jgi:bacteriocin biosynthesis cyclodehydratase domain-containing protein
MSIMIRSHSPKFQKRRLLAVGQGAFFDAMAHGLCEEGHIVETELSPPFARRRLLEDEADLAVFVSTRLASELFNLDEIMSGLGTPWIVVELASERLRVGPGLRAGLALCRACVERRMLAHLGPDAAQEELECRAHLADQQVPGVGGFLPTTVGFAIEGVQSLLDGRLDWGVVREIDLLGLAVRQGRILPVHACRRCRPETREPQRRFVEDLAIALAKR